MKEAVLIPFAFQSESPGQFIEHSDICSVEKGSGPKYKRRGFVNVLIPSVLSSVKDNGTLVLNNDIRHICTACHDCVDFDKAATNLDMGVWFLGENGELNPHSAKPYREMLSMEHVPKVLMLRGSNFYQHSKNEGFDDLKLEECVKTMEKENKVALVWSMIRTTNGQLVGWDTVVIINPLFSTSRDCPTKDLLAGILIENLLKPLLDLNQNHSEVTIVHDMDESYKPLATYLKASFEKFWKSVYDPDISISQLKEYLLEGKDFIGSAYTKKLFIDLELNIYKKAYKRLATAMGEYEDFKTIVELDKVDDVETLIERMVMFFKIVSEKRAAASEETSWTLL
jgi:hypothetical protein